ncbi:MAG: DUF11 domain-containing protein, partial [Anaerolineae bacterium]|nr:DUF11 domain-containing protein [Anaerolineae bacterium]
GILLTRTVDALEVYLDAENDRITGVAEPFADIACRVLPLTEKGQALLSVSTTANASGMYTVELSSIATLLPGNWNGCYVHDDEGDDLNLWQPAFGAVYVNQTYDTIAGRAYAPSGPNTTDRQVTVTLFSADSTSTMVFNKAMEWSGEFNFSPDDGLPDIQPGDVVTVSSEGYSWQGIVEVDEIEAEYHTDNDQFTGEVDLPSNRVEVFGAYWGALSSGALFPVGGDFAVAVTANSPFTAETAGFDVRNGVEYHVLHNTEDELANEISGKTDNIRMWSQYNGVVADFPPAGAAYTLTLRDGGGGLKVERTGQSGGPVGEAGFIDFWENEQRMESGDYIEIQSSAGLSQTLHVPETINVSFDGDADQISGSGPANTLLFLDVSDQGRGFIPTDHNGDFIIAIDQLQQLDGDGDFQEGQTVMVCYLVLEGSQICYSYDWPSIRIDVNYAHQWFEIQTVPDATVYLTLTDSNGALKGTLFGDSDGGGSFRNWEWDGNWFPERPDIVPGDGVTVTAAGLEGVINPIGEVYGDIDLVNDVVTGTLYAPWFSPMTLTVNCEVWVDNGPPGIEITGVDPDNGEFVCDYGENGWDLQAEHDVGLRYTEPDDDSVINVFRSPWVRVNYGHDWVGGDYPAGYTFWITQTQAGIPQAYAEVDTELGRGWNGSGFETQVDSWTPPSPDLQEGDVILFTGDDGYTNTVTAGEITGNLDIGADYISGTVNAPWFSSALLHLICEVWNDQGGRVDQFVDAENGVYECDFSGQVDIQTGDSVAVMYVEPDDGDYVINVFEEPGPDVAVEKWTEGDPTAGGRFIYWIEYWNHERGEAYNVMITDTLPVSTTYIVDSSPFSVMTTTTQVIWDLGTLAPQSNGQFRMVVEVDPAASGSLDNHIEISTQDDRNPDNNQFDHSIGIQPADVDLAVEKWVRHSEPAPGYSFKYMIQYNNLGSTGSGKVTLTDTLPVPTSYLSYSSQDALWYVESYDGSQVVFAHPGLSGNSGNQLELTLHLSDTINIDEFFTNTVMLVTDNETGSTENNMFEHIAQARDPHMNLGVDKNFSHGTTVAGYDVTFGINYRNHDNVPANQVILTDTLPPNTSFVTSTIDVWDGSQWISQPLSPDSVTADTVVWGIGTMEPATEGYILLTLNIDESVDAGTVLTNAVEIAALGPNDYDEDYFEDNAAQASITVQDAGQNLMIIKHDRSNWQGGDPPVIQYNFEVYNVGTVPVGDLQVVDTYPDVTTFSSAELWWGGDISFNHDAGLHQAVWTITETLWPGNSFGGYVGVELDPDENRGSMFTNTIEIYPMTGDIYFTDNTDNEVLTTGPDLYVEKTTDSMWVEPGDLVTFTLTYGNKARRGEDWTQGTTRLTDTLPAGLTFITSTQMSCDGPECPYITPQIDGNKLIYDLGEMGDGWWNEIYVTAQVSDQAQGGDTFGNIVVYNSATPGDDPEGDYSNNTDAATVTVYNPIFDVSKDYETTMVAGTQVTYSLLVTNTGNESGTGVVLQDTLPSGLTYSGSDGSYSAGTVTWNLGTLAASGGTASGWFNAVLPCTLDTITNDDYAVTGSHQGATSDTGPEVTFAVVAPAIGAGKQQSAVMVEPGTTVYFTGTMSTNGTAISGYTWFFEDL